MEGGTLLPRDFVVLTGELAAFWRGFEVIVVVVALKGDFGSGLCKDGLVVKSHVKELGGGTRDLLGGQSEE